MDEANLSFLELINCLRVGLLCYGFFSSLSIAALAIYVYFLAMHKGNASFVAIKSFICQLKERVYK